MLKAKYAVYLCIDKHIVTVICVRKSKQLITIRYPLLGLTLRVKPWFWNWSQVIFLI